MTNNQTPLKFADSVSKQFRDLAIKLNCSNDDFIRTTEERHKAGVAELWKRLEQKGQIYLGSYAGWYSIRDEAYYAESELVDGKAPTGAEVQWVEEKSYFFRLSDYTQRLLQYYEDNPDFIGPKGRRNEVVSFVGQEGGLKDLSISRTTFSWGVPVPGNSEHVVYVWLDALANYITALGWGSGSDGDAQTAKYARYWPAALHVVGKDILRFHAVFWPAFLMAADLPLPKVRPSTPPLAALLSSPSSSLTPLSPSLSLSLSASSHAARVCPRVVDKRRREDEQVRWERARPKRTHRPVRP